MRRASLLSLLALAAPATAQCTTETVPGFLVSTWATLPDPTQLSFAPDGRLFVGRDLVGSGGDNTTPAAIRRVAAGGGPGVDIGPLESDPDCVLFDTAGLFAPAGQVLTGGQYPPIGPPDEGYLDAVDPVSGAVTGVLAATAAVSDPQDLALDSTGRLVIADRISRQIVVIPPGGSPTAIVSGLTAEPRSVAIDATDRIYVSLTNGEIRLYTSSGAPVGTGLFASGFTGAAPIAVGPGGAWWGTDLYAVRGTDLVRIDSAGTATVIGCGFVNLTLDLAFGPDGSLYASRFENDRIMRIAPCNTPTVPGTTLTVYASVVDPVQLAFAPDGTLFVGRDAAGSGGYNTQPVKIHRVAAGGAPVSEYGAVVIPDPDGVVVDATGAITGTAGSVLVGGQRDPIDGAGKVSRIAPGTAAVSTFLTGTPLTPDPHALAIDGTGRFLIVDRILKQVLWTTSSAPPSVLFTVPSVNELRSIAIAADGTIFTGGVAPSSAGGWIFHHTAAGVPIGGGTGFFAATSEATPPLAIGPGGGWGADLYSVDGTELVRFDASGARTAIGCGFVNRTYDLEFGPDGALYASRFDDDVIVRMALDGPLSVCAGDGSGTACPCGNTGAAGHGCGSSLAAGGARLGASGWGSTLHDSLVLLGTSMPNSSALYFQGNALTGSGAGTVFGDGLRCATGSVIRLGTKTNVAGASQFPLAGDLPISIRGAVPAGGGTRYYQIWYRNAASFCTASTFNLSNALRVAWVP